MPVETMPPTLLSVPLRPMARPRSLSMWALTALLFAQTFGDLQSVIVPGFTMQRLIVPLAALCACLLAADRIRISRQCLVLLAFVVSTTPSMLMDSGLDYLVVFVSLAGYFPLTVLVCHSVRHYEDLEALLKAYLLGHAVVALLSLLAILGIFDLGEYAGRALVSEFMHNKVRLFQGTESNPNGSALHYVVGLPVCLYMIFTTRNRWRPALIALFLLMMVELLMTFGRSAMAGAMIGCGIVVYFASTPTARRALLYLVPPLFALAFVALPFLIVRALNAPGSDINIERGVEALSELKSKSAEVHGAVLHGGFDLALSTPPWGVGFGNTTAAMEQLNGYSLNTHDVFLGLAVSYGLPSLALYLLYCGLCIREVSRAVLSEPDLRRRGAYAAILGGIIGFLVSALAHEDYVNSLFWTMLALALASGRIASSTRATMGVEPLWKRPLDQTMPERPEPG